MVTIDLTPLRTQLADLSSQGRSALLPALHLAQSIYGHVPEPVAVEISKMLNIPLADIYGVIEFYSLFYREPVGKHVIRVCTDPVCCMANSEGVIQAISQELGIAVGETTADGKYTLEPSSCLGMCEHAPSVLVDDIAIAQSHPTQALYLIDGIGKRPHGIIGGDIHRLTANCGKGRPTTLQEYLQSGGYAGLKTALTKPPMEVIQEVKASGLVGRGGAAFPTGIKWEGAANAKGDTKYVICNADESEPGTFKDRVVLEEDPHRILEGTIIAGYAIGAHEGIVYVRGEYPYAYRVMAAAIEEARRNNILGKNIFGSGFDFNLELRKGGGAYICGEETALFESIEGKRGFPRLKPPFPTTHGLFGQPTVINNVETLCNIPFIIEHGAEAFRSIGTEKSPGSKLFCLSGDVVKPGLYEVPFGATLRHLIYDLAGGLRQGRTLQAILLGGAAGAFTTAENLDVHMTFEDLKAAGLPLGSGVVLVLDDTIPLQHFLKTLARFFAHESCGKCYPCQLGTQRQYEILQRLSDGTFLPGDMQRLQDIGWTMNDASICGLGQTAAMAVLSAINLWPELFKASPGQEISPLERRPA